MSKLSLMVGRVCVMIPWCELSGDNVLSQRQEAGHTLQSFLQTLVSPVESASLHPP